MIYWVNARIGTANWLYRGVTRGESHRPGPGKRSGDADRLHAPFRPISRHRRRAPGSSAPTDLRRYTEMPSGGHFAALEGPDLLVEDIREFSRPLRFGVANDS